MISAVFASMIHDSYKNFLPDSLVTKTFDHLLTYWFSQWQLSLLCIVSPAFKLLLHMDSVLSFVWSRCGLFFCNWTLSTRLLKKQADYEPRLLELYRGVGGHAPREKFWKIGLSETPYPAFPGSKSTNLYVYFVELFSESRYSWFPSRFPSS